MKQKILTITENVKIADKTYRMVLSGISCGDVAPGQFVNIKLDGFYLRRPISVCDFFDDKLVIIYKVVGEGTLAMSEMKAGVELDVLLGLGNGYNLDCAGDMPLLIGGGAGVPPMFALAKALIAKGKHPTVICGFNTKSEVFFEDEFVNLGIKTIIATVDGSYGIKGFVTDAMSELQYTYFYTCGPEPMLKAVYNTSKSDGEFSFEERMGCGFGACMGCSCKTKYGNKRICKDGPVLKKEEIIW